MQKPAVVGWHADTDQRESTVVQSPYQKKTGCCATDEKPEIFSMTRTHGADEMDSRILPPSIDSERGLGVFEHVIANVQGMTCTGCETKLYKSITALPGIRNIRTSPARAEAEFDIELAASKGTVESIVLSLESMTDFTCK
jgi:Cd2+-exporting ATPase